MKPAATIYAGSRVRHGATIVGVGTIVGVRDSTKADDPDWPGPRPLHVEPSQSLRGHCKHFDWGNTGPGAEQLALAILLDFTNDADISLTLYQLFKWEVVSGFQHDGWMIDGDSIIQWLIKEANRKVTP